MYVDGFFRAYLKSAVTSCTEVTASYSDSELSILVRKAFLSSGLWPPPESVLLAMPRSKDSILCPLSSNAPLNHSFHPQYRKQSKCSLPAWKMMILELLAEVCNLKNGGAQYDTFSVSFTHLLYVVSMYLKVETSASLVLEVSVKKGLKAVKGRLCERRPCWFQSRPMHTNRSITRWWWRERKGELSLFFQAAPRTKRRRRSESLFLRRHSEGRILQQMNRCETSQKSYVGVTLQNISVFRPSRNFRHTDHN